MLCNDKLAQCPKRKVEHPEQFSENPEISLLDHFIDYNEK